MTAAAHIPIAAASNALTVQETHGPDDDGNCGFCLRHFGVRYRAGWCAPWQRAQAFINACTRQQERNARRLPQRREAPRTGSG